MNSLVMSLRVIENDQIVQMERLFTEKGKKLETFSNNRQCLV